MSSNLRHHVHRAARTCGFALALLLSSIQDAAASAAASAAAASSGAGVAAGGVVQVVLGLGAVLAMVGGAAWLLKRFSGIRGSGSGLIRIIGGASVGQRERIVLVEVAGTWLLVGVAPGQVRALHAMPKGESAFAVDGPPADAGLPSWLGRMSERR
jgi:flagellar protein FliO/FliZ